MILDTLKTVAVVLTIATAAIAIVVIGTFIGGLLLFLGAVALVGFGLYGLWYAIKEHRDEMRGK